jgi:two-component system, LytTR family, response regulator
MTSTRLANALMLEDELPAANRLQRLIKRCEPDLQLLAVLDSIESAQAWLQQQPEPDLIFADIHLADGLSFELFRQVPVQCPVIFTTAYDAYALKAFQLNSVDYLLKPIEEAALNAALDKWKRYHRSFPTKSPSSPVLDERLVQHLLEHWGQPRYRQRFLVRRGERLDYVPAQQVAYLYSDDGLTHLMVQQGQRELLDRTLEDISAELDPLEFFRISRKCIVSLASIQSIHKYFSGRLKLELKPNAPFEVLVSRDRVEGFQAWLDR